MEIYDFILKKKNLWEKDTVGENVKIKKAVRYAGQL